MSTAAGCGDGVTLVTGGAGFIGKHLVRLLLARGERVRVLDLDERTPPPGGSEFVHGSVLDRDCLRHALRGVRRVFHLAANPNLWVADKRTFLRINHEAVALVIDEACRARVERIVHTSTESILVSRHGRSTGIVDEGVERDVDDMCGSYCVSKLLGERAALEAAAAGAPVVVVNPTMPLGPGDDHLTPPSRMVAEFVNGKHPAFLDFVLNLVDVRDAALGHLLAAEHGRIGERYILGGHNLRLGTLLEHLETLTGRRMPRRQVPFRLALAVAAASEWFADHVSKRMPSATVTGVRLARAELHVDNGKARRELGFEPRDVEQTLRATLDSLAASGRIRGPLELR